MIRLILVSALACLILFSCSKSGKQATPPTFTAGYDVYMAGTSGGKVVYWKNGTIVDLGSYGTAQAIALNGTDVYIGGYINDSSNIEAAYWKNGQLVQLEGPGISHVFGMAINGTDVYCVGDFFGPIGSTRDSATYWKNGLRMHLSPYSNGICNAVLFAGPEMYVSGQVWGAPPNSFDSGVVWKNGVSTWYSTPGNIYAMALLGSDTIIAGTVGNQAFYLSNGKSHQPPAYSDATSAAVSGSDIYIGGGIDSNGIAQAIYWKNDTVHVLTCPYTGPGVLGVAVAGSDVYAVGSASYNGQQVPLYWKNGIATKLSDTGTVYAVAVGR
jgi:hypothetical protein